jgi:hypothetical protein
MISIEYTCIIDIVFYTNQNNTNSLTFQNLKYLGYKNSDNRDLES